MPSMLEQAIIDAEQLREVAKKTAEEKLIEKYQLEINEAMQKILNEEMPLDPSGEEDDLGLEGEPSDLGLGGETSLSDVEPLGSDESAMSVSNEGDAEVLEQLPPSHMSDDDEIIEISLEKLEEMMAAEDEVDLEDSQTERNDVAEELKEELEEETEELDEMCSDSKKKELEEEQYSDEQLDEIINKILNEEEDESESQIRTDSSGFSTQLGSSSKNKKPNRIEENYTLKIQNKELMETNNYLISENKELQNKFKKLDGVVNKLKESIDKLNLSNHKLVYQNKVLNDPSLNERQKKQIVESIASAKKVEEAKLIFETLQNSTSRPKESKETLNEVVTKSSSIVYSPNRGKHKTETVPMFETWQRLAGLKK